MTEPSLTQLGDGDRIRILNPPGFLGIGSVDLLVFGFTVSITSFAVGITLNCVPEAPFES